jgi:hypothetical protein
MNISKKDKIKKNVDTRFIRSKSDPKWGSFKKKTKKVEIDDRFSKMFTDPAFNSSSLNLFILTIIITKQKLMNMVVNWRIRQNN